MPAFCLKSGSLHIWDWAVSLSCNAPPSTAQASLTFFLLPPLQGWDYKHTATAWLVIMLEISAILESPVLPNPAGMPILHTHNYPYPHLHRIFIVNEALMGTSKAGLDPSQNSNCPLSELWGVTLENRGFCIGHPLKCKEPGERGEHPKLPHSAKFPY